MINSLFAFFDSVFAMLGCFMWVIVGFGVGLCLLVYSEYQWKKESDQQNEAHEKKLQEMLRISCSIRDRAASIEREYKELQRINKESGNGYQCQIAFLEEQVKSLYAELRHAREKGKRLAKKRKDMA
jgi:uncharacterized protein HemX